VGGIQRLLNKIECQGKTSSRVIIDLRRRGRKERGTKRKGDGKREG
jgi:hypothetical protein